MITPSNKAIDGLQVSLVPLAILDASHLDARLLALLMPLMATLDIKDLSKDVDVSLLMSKISGVLSGLTRSAQVSLMVDTLRGSTIVAPGSPAVEIQDEPSFNRAFLGCPLETLYKVLWEAWKFNKLSPFVLAERFGVKIAPTLTSGQPTEEPSRPGLRLAK